MPWRRMGGVGNAHLTKEDRVRSSGNSLPFIFLVTTADMRTRGTIDATRPSRSNTRHSSYIKVGGSAARSHRAASFFGNPVDGNHGLLRPRRSHFERKAAQSKPISRNHQRRGGGRQGVRRLRRFTQIEERDRKRGPSTSRVQARLSLCGNRRNLRTIPADRSQSRGSTADCEIRRRNPIRGARPPSAVPILPTRTAEVPADRSQFATGTKIF
jgi:hypothetical protein